MGTKRKNMEDEMSRFEKEISREFRHAPRPAFIPSQVKQFNAYNTVPLQKPPQLIAPNKPPAPLIPPPAFRPAFGLQAPATIEKTPVILSSAPKLYSRPSVPTTVEPPSTSSANAPSVGGSNFDIAAMSFEVSHSKTKKVKGEKGQSNMVAEDIIKAAKASSALQSFGNKDKRKVDKKTVRQAGGVTWEDHSLADWPDDDFRIFCGDLGNDVNDELLTRTFNKFPSFQRAKVIRDKRTNKSKGYGFVSFKEPQDFIRAMKEMDGRYVGSRPIKLRKSNWKQRSIEERRKKDVEKKALLALINN